MRPLDELNIKPGLYTIQTDRGADGRWKNGDKVRFHNGLPEKIGGWQKSGANTFTGKCRGISDWQALALTKYIALGTHLKLELWSGGTVYDITPIESTGTLGANPFTTTNGSAVVAVTHVASGRMVGDYVHFSGASAVGGITIDGEYPITTIVDSDHYQITHSVAASSGTTGGGAAVAYQYEIHVGAEHSFYGFGWGAGAYGASTYGTARTISNFLTSARLWSLDQWGEDLIACPRMGGIYLWDTSVGTSSRAAAISGAPATARSIMVSPEGQHLIALGAYSGSADDPLLVRWSSSGDYTVFTADPSNSAGIKRLNTGNEILCGIEGNKEIVIFTDSNLWTMTYTAPAPEVFAFRNVGANGSIRGANAAVEFRGVIYWMGEKNFQSYAGSIETLPCEVWPTVFDDINFVQRAKTFAWVNLAFNEIWWLYCSASSDEIDRYVAYNVDEKTWHFGTIVRTAAIGDSDIYAVPFATGIDGYLYDHETGVDEDGAAMEPFIESGDIEIGAGDYQMQIGMLVPDFKRLTGSVTLTLTAKKYPQDGESQSETNITITSSTKFVNPRIKGRQISLKIASMAIGDDWRGPGTMRIGSKQHGKK